MLGFRNGIDVFLGGLGGIFRRHFVIIPDHRFRFVVFAPFAIYAGVVFQDFSIIDVYLVKTKSGINNGILKVFLADRRRFGSRRRAAAEGSHRFQKISGRKRFIDYCLGRIRDVLPGSGIM